MTTEAAAAYRESRERIGKIVRGAGSAADGAEVPACPGWTPKDVVSHLTGVCADILAGRLDGVGTDAWTAVQVEERRSRTVDEILHEWDDVGTQVEGLMTSFPEWAANQMVFDVLSHEHDLADALRLPAPDAPQAEGPALDFAVNAFVARAESLHAPALTVVSGERKWSAKGEGPEATLTAAPLELIRCLTGRRTADQIRALDWGGADARPWLPAFEIGHFKIRDSPIVP
ncbi:MAG: maleylpyruvate isomerase family mycothiol-dependent enzyme [Actinobacteria bacterium]|nr:maleylpyruvate isomerase family mycothiol-dependent enzyme [Actinomycetota bacterium]